MSDGISSIEAFLSGRAGVYNERHPGQELPDKISVGKGQRWLSLDERIDQWIPRMAGGRKLDKSRRIWNDFKVLQNLRDDYQAHPKNPVYGLSFRDLCERLNLFRTGIAGLLLDLHAVLGTSVPEIIFRYAYLPDIEYVQEP